MVLPSTISFGVAFLLLAVASSVLAGRFARYDYNYDYGGRDVDPTDPKQKDCLAPPLPAIVPPYPKGTVISIICPEDYELVGPKTTTCDPHGYWTVAGLGYCRRRRDAQPTCNRPALHAHVTIVQQTPPILSGMQYTYKAGGFIRLACDQGYKLADSNLSTTLYCSIRGLWSGPPITCIPR